MQKSRIQLPVTAASVDEIARGAGTTRTRALHRLSELHRAGRARRVARGMYAAGTSARAELPTTPAVTRALETLHAELPAVDAVVVSTGQVASLMRNTPTREIVLVDVARILARDVAETLAADGLIALPVRSRVDMDRLLTLPGERLVGVVPVADRRATGAGVGAQPGRPERVLVDLVVARERYGLPLYGEDVAEIARGLLARYAFSVTTALDYARRRGKHDEVLRLLHSVINSDGALRAYQPLAA